MHRQIPKQDLESGQDSFLDVVSNIVGILIILVVIVGAQVKSGLVSEREKEVQPSIKPEVVSEKVLEESSENSSDENLTPDSEEVKDSKLNQELQELASEVKVADSAGNQEDPAKRLELTKQLEDSAHELDETVELEKRLEQEITQARSDQIRMEAEQGAFALETAKMQSHLSLIQKELETKTSEQDLEDRQLLQLSQESVQLERQIKEMELKIKTLLEQKNANGGPKTLEHKMTPIVHSVDSQEVHFMLDHGYVLYVPLDELMKEYERRIPGMMHSLIQSGLRTEVLGPYNGFRLHTETRLQNGQVGVYMRVIPPEIAQVGETVEQALAPESHFRHYLEKLDPAKDTLTFWIYPTGFGVFTPLKNEAYAQGFAVASRPLPEGTPIAGSPDGQRSQAQ